jgi:hypothetical protein
MNSDSAWLQVKQRYEARIQRFEETHFLGSRWISFRRISEWCSKRPHDFPNYQQIAAAILGGKFDHNGRSQILFLWIDNVRIKQKAGDIIGSPRPDFRFSLTEYRRASHQAAAVLETEYLSRFWIPRTVCARWFQDEGYPLPPWLHTPGSKAAKSVPKSGKKPKLWKYFQEHFSDGVPNPSLEPRQTLQGKLLKWDPALKPLDAGTLKAAIDEYNERLSRP